MAHGERYRQIAETLARHGFGFFIGVTGLQRWVPLHHGLLGHERREQPYSNPDHLRLALEQLGPSFVKLGQILSTRPDLLPEPYRQELAKLQDSAPPPVPAPVIAELIERELAGPPPSQIFATFDLQPLASASLGQAHAATLHDGTEVVVKVRRPHVVEQVEQDLEILRNLAARASRRWEPPPTTTWWASPKSSPIPCGPSSTTCTKPATPSDSPPTSPPAPTIRIPPNLLGHHHLARVDHRAHQGGNQDQ